MNELRHSRTDMAQVGLIRGESAFPPSLTLITAVLLLLLGVAVIFSMAFRIGPLG